MSSKTPVDYIDIRAFAHATEDPEKVLAALRNILPLDTTGTIVFAKSGLSGHYRNPITLFETRIKDRKLAQAAFEKLAAGLGVLDKELLGSELMQHLERGNLYLRLDKQSAYLGEIRLGQTDPIHFKIHFKKHTTEEVTAICQQHRLIP